MECSVVGGSLEKKLADLEVMPVCEIRNESTEGVVVPNLPNVVDSMPDVSQDESQIIVSPLLGESLEMLDDSGLRQLIENVPVELETGLEEERSEAVERSGCWSVHRKCDLFEQCFGLGEWQPNFDAVKRFCSCEW